MANFLRDEAIENLYLNEINLKQINEVFLNRLSTVNSVAHDDDKKRAILTYIIRFDGKGYRVFKFDDLLQYFHQATEIEHILFTLETGESLTTSRMIGTCLELKLSQMNPAGCYLMTTADDKDWVDAAFSAVKEILDKGKNWNGWIRTVWTRLIVQIIGVVFGFILSFWIAAKIAPKLSIGNAFIICFLFVLLVFSNVWGYMNEKLMALIFNTFPALKLYRPDKDQAHWLMQALIGGIVVAVTLWILNIAFSYLGDILSGFVGKV